MINLNELKEKYEETMRALNIEKADGDLGKLCNLNQTFDETFDKFFDDKELRKKYNAWDYENECINVDISNTDLENMLDEDDSEELKAFYINYIAELEEELVELKES